MKNKKKILSLVLGATVLGSLTLSGSSIFAKEPVYKNSFGTLTKSQLIKAAKMDINSPNLCEAQKAEARRVLPLYEAATTDEELTKVAESDRTLFIECDEQPNNVSNTNEYYSKNGWVKENNSWIYYENYKKVQNKWIGSYYLKSNGIMASNEWVKWKNEWYYVDSTGAYLRNKWIKYKGLWYYLKDNGAMAKNTTINGYYVNSEGVWVENQKTSSTKGKWEKRNGNSYYREANGEYAKKKWISYEGKWYYLKDNGAMAKNTTINGYYVNSEGEYVDRNITTKGWKIDKNTSLEELQKWKEEVKKEHKRLLNELRRKYNLNELKEDEVLGKGTAIRSEEQARTKKQSHTRPNGSDFSTAFNDHHDRYISENIWSELYWQVEYFSNPTEAAKLILDTFYNSQGHRENMLHPKMNLFYMDIAFNMEEWGSNNKACMYITQNFAKRD